MKPERVRVFFGLWPEALTLAGLTAAARRMEKVLHGRRTSDESIHLTLAFVGDIDATRLPLLLDPPVAATATKFDLNLDRWGCWSRNEIGWVAPATVPDAMLELVYGLETWLREAGFAMEARVYRPHITLVRKAQCAPLAESLPPIAWPAGEFLLVRTQLDAGGSRYQMIRKWPLR